MLCVIMGVLHGVLRTYYVCKYRNSTMDILFLIQTKSRESRKGRVNYMQTLHTWQNTTKHSASYTTPTTTYIVVHYRVRYIGTSTDSRRTPVNASKSGEGKRGGGGSESNASTVYVQNTMCIPQPEPDPFLGSSSSSFKCLCCPVRLCHALFKKPSLE